MATVPKFIEHYIDQAISEECVIELQQLARDYEAQRNKIDNPERHEGDRRYKGLTGKENPNSVTREVKALEDNCKAEAKKIATKHAEKEGVKLVELVEKESEKSKEEKSQESERNLDESQVKMQESIAEKKARIKEEIKAEFEKAAQFRENKRDIER